MNDISDLATQWGVAAEYFDAFGNRKAVDPDILAHIVDAISGGQRPQQRLLPKTVVLRQGRGHRVDVHGHVHRTEWDIAEGARVVASGAVDGGAITVPHVPVGTYTLRVTAATPAGKAQESAMLLMAPPTTFQGRDPSARLWVL